MTARESHADDTDPEPTSLVIETIQKAHKRKDFVCEAAPGLAEYIQKTARQDARKGVRQTFAAVWPDGTIAGYYTLASLSIELTDLPADRAKKLPRYPLIPTALLGRLAVDDRYAKNGYGEFLLMDALYRAMQVSKQMSVYAIVTEPRDADARSFYKKYDFEPLLQRSDRLFLPVSVIRQIFA